MPMIMLNVICELRAYRADPMLYADVAIDCVAQIKIHVHVERQAVLETVATDGR